MNKDQRLVGKGFLFFLCVCWRLTYLGHVESRVLHPDAPDDELECVGSDVLHGDAGIVRHHGEVDGLDGLRIRLNPSHLEEGADKSD